MSWPQSQWQQQPPPQYSAATSSTASIGTASSVVNSQTSASGITTATAVPPLGTGNFPPAGGMPNIPSSYTPNQYAALSPEQQFAIQQNWQQWQTYHQQYAQWHAQYGEQYQREMQAKLGMVAPQIPFVPPVPGPTAPYQPTVMPPTVPYTSVPPPPPDQSSKSSAMGVGNMSAMTSQPPPPPPPPPEEKGIKIETKIDQISYSSSSDLNSYVNKNQQQQLNQNHWQQQKVWQQSQQSWQPQQWSQPPPSLPQNQQNQFQQPPPSIQQQQPQQSQQQQPQQQQQQQQKFSGGSGSGQFYNNKQQNERENDYCANNRSNSQDWKNSRNNNWQNKQQQQQHPQPQQQPQSNQGKFSNVQSSSNDDNGEKTPEERVFDEQFRKWEEDFENWKKQNANHPDKKAYKEYEMKFEECRRKLLERREQMKRRKLESKMKQTYPQQQPSTQMNENSNSHIKSQLSVQEQNPLLLQQQQQQQQHGQEQNYQQYYHQSQPQPQTHQEHYNNFEISKSKDQLISDNSRNVEQKKMNEQVLSTEKRNEDKNNAISVESETAIEKNMNIEKNIRINSNIDNELSKNLNKNIGDKNESKIEEILEKKIEKTEEQVIEFLKTTKTECGGIPGLDLVPQNLLNESRLDNKSSVEEISEVIDLENDLKKQIEKNQLNKRDNSNIADFDHNSSSSVLLSNLSTLNRERNFENDRWQQQLKQQQPQQLQQQSQQQQQQPQQLQQQSQQQPRIPSLLDQKIEKPTFSPPRNEQQNSSGFGQFLNENLTTVGQHNNQGDIANQMGNNSELADLTSALQNPNVLALLTAALNNAGGDINKLSEALLTQNNAITNTDNTIGDLGSGPKMSPWMSGQEPFKNRSGPYGGGGDGQGFASGGWRDRDRDRENNFSSWDNRRNQQDGWQRNSGGSDGRGNNRNWNDNRRSKRDDNSFDRRQPLDTHDGSNTGPDLMNDQSQSSEKSTGLNPFKDNNVQDSTFDERSRDRNKRRRFGSQTRSDRSRSEKGDSCDRSRSSSRQGDIPPLMNETRNPRNPFRNEPKNIFGIDDNRDRSRSRQRDDDYFRPAQVIDYQNRSLPTKVVDYGHKSSNISGNNDVNEVFGGNFGRNSIGNDNIFLKDDFFPMKTIDYGHSSVKNNPQDQNNQQSQQGWNQQRQQGWNQQRQQGWNQQNQQRWNQQRQQEGNNNKNNNNNNNNNNNDDDDDNDNYSQQQRGGKNRRNKNRRNRNKSGTWANNPQNIKDDERTVQQNTATNTADDNNDDNKTNVSSENNNANKQFVSEQNNDSFEEISENDTDFEESNYIEHISSPGIHDNFADDVDCNIFLDEQQQLQQQQQKAVLQQTKEEQINCLSPTKTLYLSSYSNKNENNLTKNTQNLFPIINNVNPFETSISLNNSTNTATNISSTIFSSISKFEGNITKITNESIQSPPAQLIISTMANNNTITIDEILLKPGRVSRPKKIVIILRGPPGSGKTYVAKLIKEKEVEMGGSAPRLLSIDDYFMTEIDKEEKCVKTGRKIIKKEMVYEYDKAMEGNYMQYLLKSFKKTINDRLFDFIIVDCVNSTLRTFTEFYNIAKESDFTPFTIELRTDLETCLSRNIHNRNENDIKNIIMNWRSTPDHYIKLDITSLLQSAAIQDIEMEDISDAEDDNITNMNQESMEDDEKEENFLKSKWDADTSNEKLARLDGLNKPLQKSTTMEDYLQLDDWDPQPTTSGKKRVRWADIEEKRTQEKLRAIGFVVGHTDWKRMMDPSGGSNALTKTKYIERIEK